MIMIMIISTSELSAWIW